ncbi:hypothetical protein C8J57DRAFT_1534669 [Mycena rebaudengoi]|nr:hypothetical protein C8J57DRAFT_1534669 [Mycena rebaudengoi]
MWTTASRDTLAARTWLLGRVAAVAALHIGRADSAFIESSASAFASEAYSDVPAPLRYNPCLLTGPIQLISPMRRSTQSSPAQVTDSFPTRTPCRQLEFQAGMIHTLAHTVPDLVHQALLLRSLKNQIQAVPQ